MCEELLIKVQVGEARPMRTRLCQLYYLLGDQEARLALCGAHNANSERDGGGRQREDSKEAGNFL